MDRPQLAQADSKEVGSSADDLVRVVEGVLGGGVERARRTGDGQQDWAGEGRHVLGVRWRIHSCGVLAQLVRLLAVKRNKLRKLAS